MSGGRFRPLLPVGQVLVRGRSMEPHLHDGDRLLVRWDRAAVRAARPGAVAVVQLPGGRPLSIKRLAFRESGGWWVERDNPAEGVDSWQVGAVPEADVLGIALARIWPKPGKITGPHRAGPQGAE
jgi:nickel-type superoxide dismutase maturation protease